jgi:putative endonuclease
MYIGVTNNLPRRLNEHQSENSSLFTSKYHTHKLVYYEEYSSANEAIEREKQLKKWSRQKKNRLVESMNPFWDDLGSSFL